jgi:hypothetical protein
MLIYGVTSHLFPFLKGVDAKWHLTGSWRNWSELHFGKEMISIKINQKNLWSVI